MKRIYFAAISTMLIAVSILSCKKESTSQNFTVDCTTVTNKAFAADINPIIQTSCNKVSCHAAGSSNGPGALTNYTEVFNARAAIRPVIVSARMPQDASLSSAQKGSIICWIDSGAPNN